LRETHFLITLLSEHKVIGCAQWWQASTLGLVVLVAGCGSPGIYEFVNQHVFQLRDFLMILHLLIERHIGIILTILDICQLIGCSISFLGRLLLGS
jgi:hypothetical protein